MGLPFAARGGVGLVGLAAALASGPAIADAGAQDRGVVVADGLNRPMGVLVTPDGSVWVVESGTGGDQERAFLDPITRQQATARIGETSRILRIAPDGAETVVHVLPSIAIGSDQVYGGDRLVMLDGALYVTSGGWSEGNPGDRLPLVSAVVRVVGEERTEVANTWDVERDRNPDGTLIETNPYGLTVGPDGMLWVADAAGNTLLRLDPESGRLDVVVVFEGVASPLPSAHRGGANETDPVPTAVAFDEQGNAYVSFLPGFPFLPGSAKVVKVTPRGEVSDYATGLTMLTDLRRGPDGELYAVTHAEFTERGPTPNSGAIVRVREGDASEVVVTGLSFPTSIDFNADGDAFVTANAVGPAGAGEIRKYAGVAVRR